MQEEIEQKSFNIMISTTKLSARTVLRAVKAAFRLSSPKHPKVSKASAPFCGKTGVCPAWRSARPASVGWNAMPKSTASTMLSARTIPRCRPGIWSFFKAPDAEAFHSAFKEYSASLLNKDKRPSVLAKLHKLVQAAAELPGKVRHKEQERGL